MSQLWVEQPQQGDCVHTEDEVEAVAQTATSIVLLTNTHQLFAYDKTNALRELQAVKELDEIVAISSCGHMSKTFLALTQSGTFYEVDPVADSLGTKVETGDSFVSCIAAGSSHCLYLDSEANVWSKGPAPQAGLVQDSTSSFQQVPFFTDVDVLQIAAGEDFSLALISHKKKAVLDDDSSGVEETDCASTPKTSFSVPSCPLGLPLHAVTRQCSFPRRRILEDHEEDVGREASCDFLEEPVKQQHSLLASSPPSDVSNNKTDGELADSPKADDDDDDQQLGSPRSDKDTSERSSNNDTCESTNSSSDEVFDAGKKSSAPPSPSDDDDHTPVEAAATAVDEEPGGNVEVGREADDVSFSRSVDLGSKQNDDLLLSTSSLSSRLSESDVVSAGYNFVTGLGRVWNSSKSLLSGGAVASDSGIMSDTFSETGDLDSNASLTSRSAVFSKCHSEPPNNYQVEGVSTDDIELTLPSHSQHNFVSKHIPRASVLEQLRRASFKHKKSASFGWQSNGKLATPSQRLSGLAEGGSRLMKCEVWSWGSGRRGQLGQGDMLARPTPSAIQRLAGKGIMKVVTGISHALALTASGQVYGWGDNSKGQVNPSEKLAVVLSPILVSLGAGETARDMTASSKASVVLTDSGNFVLLGSHGNSNSRFQIIKLNSLGLGAGRQVGSCWLAQDITIVNPVVADSATCGVISREKVMADQASCVVNVLDDLDPSSFSTTKEHPKNPNPLKELAFNLRVLSELLHVSVKQSWNCYSQADIWRTGLYQNLPALQLAFSKVNTSLSDFLCADVLMLDSVQSFLQPTMVDLLTVKFGVRQDHVRGQDILEQLLLELSRLLPTYLSSLMRVQIMLTSGSGPTMGAALAELANLVRRHEKERQEADRTRHFWKSAGQRLLDLKLPYRRMVLDSRSQPLTVAGHALARHWLVLLSDMLVHAGYSQVATHHLSTVWLEAPTVKDPSGRYEIHLTMPEENLVLIANSSAERSVWIQGIQKCILATISGARYTDYEKLVSPPVSRNASFVFGKGDRKGARYLGSWMQGKMHGKGTMKWPDGGIYSGGWRGGEKHGRGVYTLASGERQEGTWTKGQLGGWGRLTWEGGTVYEGQLEGGLPHGHGVKKEGRFMGSGAAVYTGEWEGGLRHGYGVLEDIMAGEKYMGMWVAGNKQGKGCVVTSDGVYYEGNFQNNKLVGGGIMLFEDGAKYVGDFAGAGEFCGRGTLTSGRDTLAGTFHGNYTDGMKFSGMVYKNSVPLSPVVGTAEINIQQFTVDPNLKWTSIFKNFRHIINPNESLSHPSQAWDQLAIYINQNKVTAREENSKELERLREGLDQLELIPEIEYTLSWSHYTDIAGYLRSAANCWLHPLAQVLKQLCDSYTASYGGVRSHPTLLPHATLELSSLAGRLYKIMRELFPALPEASLYLKNPDTSESGVMVNANTLLYPLLLPPLHPTIFMLYALKEQKNDKEYWARILRWNKHPDSALLTFLEVDSRLWCSKPTTDHRGRDQHFLASIETLQRIKTTFTPDDKLNVIVQMFKDITNESSTQLTWSMDALLPVCMYVVVRARVLQLGAELTMLSDLMETHLFQGEHGIMFTTLQAAYLQILRESVFIN